MLKVTYAFFVGILLAVFVGVGISTFYSEPARPNYTYEIVNKTDSEIATQEEANRAISDQYNKEIDTYHRNVSIIALVSAIVFVAAGLLLASKIHVLSDGLLLGGIFTLIYSLVRSFIFEDNAFRFIVVTIGLIVALVLGYIKFIKPEQSKAK